MKSEWMEIITLIPAMLFVGVLLALMLFPIVWMVIAWLVCIGVCAGMVYNLVDI